MILIENKIYSLEVLRGFWGLNNDPIANIVDLLEENGIIVSSLATVSTKIDAFTQIHNISGHHQFCVVMGNDKQSMVRRNFDAAHELGHIILHSKLNNIKELSNEEFKELEVEANHFAASFLLPKNDFFADLVNPTNLEAYLQLKKKWKVSVSVMVMRAKQLGRVSSLRYVGEVEVLLDLDPGTLVEKKFEKNKELILSIKRN